MSYSSKVPPRESLQLMPYQQKAYDFIMDRMYLTQTSPYLKRACGLFLDMGLGKTAIVLSVLRTMLTEDPSLGRILIIAPKRVAEVTWPAELAKWKQFQYITYRVITGAPTARVQAAQSDAHIHIVSRDNIVWLTEQCVPTGPLRWVWDTVVIDELSSFKNHNSKRWVALRRIHPKIKRMIGMTGTPAPNGLMDLWAQTYLLDGGVRLGRSIGTYRSTFFFNHSQIGQFPDYRPKQGAIEAVSRKLSDLCISMQQEDYIKLPPMIINEQKLDIIQPVMQQYRDFKQKMVLQLRSEPGAVSDDLQSVNPLKAITAVSAGVLAGKLLQFCGGKVYDESRMAHNVHETKTAALDAILESAQEEGENVIVYYSYQSEMQRLLQHYPQAKILASGTDVIKQWNAGEVPLLIAHPASAGHGLNLQQGGRTIVWYNLTYDLELWLQANKRLHRIGQSKPVLVTVLTLRGCIDSMIYNSVLKNKGSVQQSVIDELKVI